MYVYDCGHQELVTDAVLRNVCEIKLLFPSMKITTNLIFDWCMVIESKRTIKRILVKNYKPDWSSSVDLL